MTVNDYIAKHLSKMKEVCSNIAFKFYLDQDDHFQDCLVIAIRLSASYRETTGTSPNGFFAWWYRLCRNHAIDRYRRNQKAPLLVDEIYGHGVEGTATRYDNRHELASIYWRVRKRFGSRASVIMYMTSHQYHIEDISAQFNMPTGTVKGMVHRIRNYLTPKPHIMAENKDDNWVKPVNPLLEVIPGRTKKCRGKCGLIREMNEFHNNKSNKDGKQDICKPCTADFMRDYNARKAVERKSQLTAGDVKMDPMPMPPPAPAKEKKVKLPPSITATLRSRDAMIRYFSSSVRLRFGFGKLATSLTIA